ncbi:hypothetical protein CkaCkLH20_00521 [Colletotrichum karsti]|uniref:Zinc-binding loop region of homing endonuclease domain-containing protein n=1 Tax=Colletotrichum karsti TaxID=1095194 RepID=A0A9P6IGL1_9PEZI|nr:uncharacterized protein CkaCkLH20_00521 [Colletotrichum karsti]KAF9882485.1 hypothetical protein CkaCkLH20_00521 [Colletotrichum karsti]
MAPSVPSRRMQCPSRKLPKDESHSNNDTPFELEENYRNSSEETLVPAEIDPVRGKKRNLQVKKRKRAYEKYSTNQQAALDFLQNMDVTTDGWCQLSTLAPNKPGGYAQVSSDGAKKFCTLQEMVVFAAGLKTSSDTQISHLCDKPLCTVPSHVTVESPEYNNRRKGCVAWMPCGHYVDCPLRTLCCEHRPRCITFAEGFGSYEDFLERGVHEKELLPDEMCFPRKRRKVRSQI